MNIEKDLEIPLWLLFFIDEDEAEKKIKEMPTAELEALYGKQNYVGPAGIIAIEILKRQNNDIRKRIMYVAQTQSIKLGIWLLEDLKGYDRMEIFDCFEVEGRKALAEKFAQGAFDFEIKILLEGYKTSNNKEDNLIATTFVKKLLEKGIKSKDVWNIIPNYCKDEILPAIVASKSTSIKSALQIANKASKKSVYYLMNSGISEALTKRFLCEDIQVIWHYCCSITNKHLRFYALHALFLHPDMGVKLSVPIELCEDDKDMLFQASWYLNRKYKGKSLKKMFSSYLKALNAGKERAADAYLSVIKHCATKLDDLIWLARVCIEAGNDQYTKSDHYSFDRLLKKAVSKSKSAKLEKYCDELRSEKYAHILKVLFEALVKKVPLQRLIEMAEKWEDREIRFKIILPQIQRLYLKR